MKKFTINGKLWRYGGQGAWHFVYVNEKISRQIKDANRNTKKVGWAFARVKATLGKTSWKTSLFPTKDGPFLLAVKADVRAKEGVADGDSVKVECVLL